MSAKKEAPAGANGLGQIKETSLYQQYTDSLSNCQSTAAAAQRQRILEHLQRGTLSTLQARSVGIMHPAARCMELRKQGHQIVTEKVDECCPGGVRHRVARYRLQPTRQMSLLDLLEGTGGTDANF